MSAECARVGRVVTCHTSLNVKTQRLLQLELLQGSMLRDTFHLNEIIYVKVLSKVPKIQQVLN